MILVEFILRNITFSPEYAASVEQKQIAEQQAQQAFFVVEQRRQEAEQARQVAQGKADAAVIEAQGAADGRIIQAQAEAEALQKISEVLAQNEQLLSYRYIEELHPGHPGDAAAQRQPLLAAAAHPGVADYRRPVLQSDGGAHPAADARTHGDALTPTPRRFPGDRRGIDYDR